MNSKGYSALILIVLAVIAIIIITLIAGAVSRSSQESSLKDKIKALNIGGLKSESCSTGDGVDSGPECGLSYSSNIADVETALKDAGYTPDSASSSATHATYTGNNLVFQVGTSGNVTTSLLASRGN